jgi:predicted esterase
MPPKPAAKMPAILWVHWLGEPETTNHTEFLADANALAERGVVSLLVDMPWSQKDWFTGVRAPEHDYDDVVAQVVSLRRALDFLTSVRGVDPSRIAYVGHDFGAMDGALLLAVDDRPRFAVLMTPALSFWEWDLLGRQPVDRAAYVAQMSAFDLPAWLARGTQSATLLQFATKDDYVANATASVVRNAVPDRGRTFKRYDTGHALDVPAAHADRRAWLLAQFGLTDSM